MVWPDGVVILSHNSLIPGVILCEREGPDCVLSQGQHFLDVDPHSTVDKGFIVRPILMTLDLSRAHNKLTPISMADGMINLPFLSPQGWLP